MRFDRSITLNLVQPFRRALSPFKSLAPRLDAIPILMYHGISDDPEPGVGPYYKTNTSPAVFRQHMEFLAENAYQTISLPTLLASLPTPASLRTSRVAITFDDGLRNFYNEAFPVLKQHGFTATMFLASAFIGETRRSFAPRSTTSAPSFQCSGLARECMTWNEVRELRKAGMDFGSHTVNHPKLVELGWPDIKSEISNSKSEIEQQLGEPVPTFAYPYAYPQMDPQFITRFTSELRDAGYLCCATTEVGRLRGGDNPYRLKRLPVNSLDDSSLFRAKLEGAYDWLAAPQAFIKRLKRRARVSREPRRLAGAGAEVTLN